MKIRIRLTENDLHKIVKESVQKILKESYDKNYVEFEDIKKGILSCQGLKPSEKHALLKFWNTHENLLLNFDEIYLTFNDFLADAEEEYPEPELPEGWTLKDIYYTTKHIISDMGFDNINYNDYEEQFY
jgi:hypothetical protein